MIGSIKRIGFLSSCFDIDDAAYRDVFGKHVVVTEFHPGIQQWIMSRNHLLEPVDATITQPFIVRLHKNSIPLWIYKEIKNLVQASKQVWLLETKAFTNVQIINVAYLLSDVNDWTYVEFEEQTTVTVHLYSEPRGPLIL